MRTYTRRPKEDKIIEDVESLCRLCLSRAEETVPIFHEGNACAALPMRIMSCLGFDMKEESFLPNKICTTCHQELERYYKFRRKCEESYMKLKSHVTAIMLRDRIKTIDISNGIKEDNRDLEYDTRKNSQVDEMEQLVIADICSIEEHRDEDNVTRAILSVDSDNVQENTADLEEKVKETSEIQATLTEPSNDINPDISTFLNAILVELGILVRSEEGLAVRDQGVPSFELETGEGDQVLFELVEEDENEEATRAPSPKITFVEPEQCAETKKCVKGKKRIPLGKKNGAWCGICARTFATASAARRHGAVHTGARPHACPECGRAFAQRAVMHRHRLVHTAERPFKCDECKKSFTQRGALERHVRAHAPAHARPLTLHACARCPRMFLYASGLSRHMLTHAGHTFACEHCARHFNDKSSLARHTRTTHPHL